MNSQNAQSRARSPARATQNPTRAHVVRTLSMRTFTHPWPSPPTRRGFRTTTYSQIRTFTHTHTTLHLHAYGHNMYANAHILCNEGAWYMLTSMGLHTRMSHGFVQPSATCVGPAVWQPPVTLPRLKWRSSACTPDTYVKIVGNPLCLPAVINTSSGLSGMSS